MKKIISIGITFLLCLLFTSLHAQKHRDTIPQKKDVLKINLSALAFKNISLQYERKTGRKSSIALNVHTIPFSSLPFQSTFSSVGNNSDVQYSQFKLGSFGIVPEYRFYLSRAALHGFYLGFFFNYNNYKANLPVTYNSNGTTKTGIFTGSLNTYTGGLQLGTQFSLGKSITLDWWILGPNYGSGSGTFNLSASLSPSEQSDLSNKLQDIQNNAPFNAIKSYSVSSTGASLQASGPWLGLRGLGFNLGIRF